MLTVFIANCIKISAYKSKKNHIRTHFCILITVLIWQGHKDLNPEPTVLETAALPIELYPYMLFKKPKA